MPYALNTKKGTRLNHPEHGEFVGGAARKVTEDTAKQMKSIKDMVIFDSVEE